MNSAVTEVLPRRDGRTAIQESIYASLMGASASGLVGKLAHAFAEPTSKAIIDFVEQDANKLVGDKNGIETAAMLLAIVAHKNERRLDGHPYVAHTMAVAAITACLLEDCRMNQDEKSITIACAHLHDFVESLIHKTDERPAEIIVGQSPTIFPKHIYIVLEALSKNTFEVNKFKAMLDLVTRNRNDGSKETSQINDARIAMSNILGAVVIKFADRMHNMMNPIPTSGDKFVNYKNDQTQAGYKLANKVALTQHETLGKLVGRRNENDFALVVNLKWDELNIYLNRPEVQKFLKRFNIDDLDIGNPPHKYDAASETKNILNVTAVQATKIHKGKIGVGA